jgi:hypothetical protein
VSLKKKTRPREVPREVLLLEKELLVPQVSPLELDHQPESPRTEKEDSSKIDAGDTHEHHPHIDSDMSAGNMLLHLRKLRALFEYADTDNSGSISRKELLQAVR